MNRIGILGGISCESTIEYRTEAKSEDVILGCTELPLIHEPGDRDIPFFDIVELHTEAALLTALEA